MARGRRRWVAFAFVVAVGLAGPRAHAAAGPDADAGPSDPKARNELAAGMEKFDAGDFAGAQRDFRASFDKERNPLSLWGLAQATNKVDGCHKSVPLYRQFSKMVDGGSEAYDVALQAIAECADKLASEDDVSEDDPIDLDESDESDESDSDTPEDSPEPDRPWHRDPLGGVLVGIGAAATATGIGLLVGATVEHNNPCEQYDCFEQQQDKVDRLTIAGAVVTGVGGALLLGGVIRWAVLGARQRNRTSALPIAHPRFVGFSLRGRF